jgi:hypothetical protein
MPKQVFLRDLVHYVNELQLPVGDVYNVFKLAEDILPEGLNTKSALKPLDVAKILLPIGDDLTVNFLKSFVLDQ